MSGNREILLGACLSAVLAAAMLAAPQGHASESCAQQVEQTKRKTGDVTAPMPHMGVAARHVAAAEAALQSGDEAKCLEELQKTEKWLLMNRSHHSGR